ncbi:hypothetical protein CLCAR_3029 [Clostridium carboxidivorans P7]|nr:hypothetical protein CLCAR_3029 [Clostridium carboxidivorans P7]
MSIIKNIKDAEFCIIFNLFRYLQKIIDNNSKNIIILQLR